MRTRGESIKPSVDEAAAELSRQFQVLTDYAPLSWQSRLFVEHLRHGEIPGAIDIPTGLGKTAIMALWLIARSNVAHLPRRLVYVVDRRAVVDQATDFAVKLRDRLDLREAAGLKAALALDGRSLPISTLRGRHVDNREWLEDPSSMAIIVGTVDLIGSRLLFEGYGVSRKMRPYHAGLLCADTLVVLDEAHLIPSFEKLLETVEGGAALFGARDQVARAVVPAFKVLSLSATGRRRKGMTFRLQACDLEDPIVKKRLAAPKAITVIPASEETLVDTLATKAWALAENGDAPVRCIVFCDKRETAEKTKAEIEALASGDKRQDGCKIEIETELFVGARRVFERDQAAANLRAMGFIAGSAASRRTPAFLIATSAGEVGVDLDADHMVCDLVAWERMVQRLGRVNRRGESSARVIVVDPGPPKSRKENSPAVDEVLAIERHEALRAVIAALPDLGGDSRAGSPGAMRDLKLSAAENKNLGALIERASTQAPLRPVLTRGLIDAWSMTSLQEHTGRPEVGPWLRGWVDDKPQTAVVWRAHLPVRVRGTQPTKREIEDFFEAAPPHASERLETETYRVSEWLAQRAKELLTATPETVAQNQGLLPQRDDIVGFVLSAAGDLGRMLRLGNFIADSTRDKEELEKWLRGATLILDARVGGLREGLLDPSSAETPRTIDDGEAWAVPLFRVRSDNTHQHPEDHRTWRERFRFVTEQTQDGEPVRWLIVEKWRDDSANEEDRSVGPLQLLDVHQEWTMRKVRELAGRLGLADSYASMLSVAARLHDEGKRVPRWQRAFNAPRDGRDYAKTTGPLNFALLDHYRHEFGSLAHAERDLELRALAADLQDLALHLIAAHHGLARPIIATNGCEDAPPSALGERARNVAVRYARLQRRWGPWGLAWWEALFRAADQQASRENDASTVVLEKEPA